MTVEKIIDRIKQDASDTVKQIIREAEEEAKQIIEDAEKQAEEEAKQIIEDGKRQSKNLKRIHISKANQEAQRIIMKVREEIIEECFTKAKDRLKTLSDEEYRNIITNLIEETKKKIPDKLVAYTSRDEDENILKSYNIPVKGHIEATGGFILQSSDGTKRIDNTFEGILDREKQNIRTVIGKILFTRS